MESAAIHSSEVHEVDSGIPMTLFKVFFYLSVSPARRAPHPNQAFSIVFTTPSVPLLGDRNLRRKDVTALSADFSTSPSLLQGELHILTKPSLLEKGRM